VEKEVLSVVPDMMFSILFPNSVISRALRRCWVLSSYWKGKSFIYIHSS